MSELLSKSRGLFGSSVSFLIYSPRTHVHNKYGKYAQVMGSFVVWTLVAKLFRPDLMVACMGAYPAGSIFWGPQCTLGLLFGVYPGIESESYHFSPHGDASRTQHLV